VGVLGPFGDFSTQVWASDPALLGSEASAVVTRSFPKDPAKSSFNSLIEAEIGWNNVDDRAQLFQPLLETLIPIDFDGPAQDSDSHNVFQYTFATLLNDPEKYSQVLFWYFGGKPYRVTKALRIPLDPGYWPPGRSSFVQDAALDSNGNPKGALVRGQEILAQATAARAAPGKVAAAKAAATALEAAKQKLSRARTAGPQATAQQQVDQAVAAQQAADKEAADQTTAAQVPLGRALFIGFAGNDPAGG